MKLPFRENAYIPKEKLIGYLLAEHHPVGSKKAVFFRRLGFNETNINHLAQLLLQIAQSNKVTGIRNFFYGTNYVIEGIIKTPIRKEVKIRTVWFIKIEKVKPSFVTAYPV